MQHNKTRLMAASGATLALIVAGTAAVAAYPGDRGDRNDQRGFGGGMAQAERGFGGGMAQAERGFGGGMIDGGMIGDRGAMRGGSVGGFRGAIDDFERRETTLQTADGTTTHRVEQGMVDSSSDTGLEFSLASGETVAVVFDDDTQALALSEQTVVNRRGISFERMVPAEIEVGAIEAGSEVIVWSGSEDGSGFVADRIVVQATLDEALDAATEATDADTEATDADAAAIAPATDA